MQVILSHYKEMKNVSTPKLYTVYPWQFTLMCVEEKIIKKQVWLLWTSKASNDEYEWENTFGSWERSGI